MRANGLINFVLVTTATACLFGVVTKPEEVDDSPYLPSKYTLPVDTPEVDEDPDLLYKFKNNNGTPPMLDPKSKLYLEEPENIKTDVEYDPKTGNYIVKQKMGDQNYRPETYMNLKEYQEYMYRKQMKEYWRSRVAADELNNQPHKGIIPKLQVNSELFDRIFGGNTVDIKPTGTAELIFGLNRNVNRNPAIPQRQQKVTNFDFNMRIQLNLIGKIGDKLKVTTNYNTEASFDWENQVKVDYTGYEDEIIKKIEAGNVTLPLNSSLISGSQTLFGFKTTLQFGKLTATTVFSQQKGKKQEITVQGSAQMQNFSIGADNYEQNKHFYLGHYFRKNYDAWMNTLPVIQTPIIVTKIEVYVLSNNGSSEQTRNIIAFEDLGENAEDVAKELTDTSKISKLDFVIRNTSAETVPSNTVNNLYSILTVGQGGNKAVIATRTFSDVAILSDTTLASNKSNPNKEYMAEGRDFVKIQNARRLNTSEYIFNPRTGYISLSQQLNNDQALAVSYQFTHNGKIYQVGEFSEQVPDNTQLLICKLLKTNAVSVRHQMWKLMMKNVYSLGAYNLNPQDFKLDVFYNNNETGVDIPYLPYGKNINGKQLIRVLQCDKLSVNGDRGSDGVYDFIPGYTVSQINGRVYFPTEEPFGRSLIATKTSEIGSTENDNKFIDEDFPKASQYIFTELYDSTKAAASQIQNKNRFKIKGSYRSSSGSEIALNALNIPQGAVVVTANGIALQENTDYTVDYTLGRVKIINEGILNSGATIKITLESNSMFQVQNKSLWGTRLDYKAGRNLTLGGTFLRFSERPMTQKVTIGDEPVSNVIAGVDFNYKTDAPFLTRLLDKLPFYSTKEMSSITTRGEFAKLFPGNARAIKQNGGNSYIDDFEGSVSVFDVKNPTSWYLASIPKNIPGVFPESSEANSNTFFPGINRAHFIWYTVDPMFTRKQSNTTPSHYTTKLFSNNMFRQVFETELFPGKTPPSGQQVVLPLLDLALYPTERGPYNYDVNPTQYSKGINFDGTLKDPKSRWGGMMRKLETNDFQAANVEYIQFWMMDPFNEDYNSETDSLFDENKLPEGHLYINLGNISEDIVKDGKMTYENGIPGTSSYANNLTIDSTRLADAPILAPIINAFSQDDNDRLLQDVGYDGLSDENERKRFRVPLAEMKAGNFSDAAKAAFESDPSSDRYHFFRGDDYDSREANTLKRYSKYNNPEGNSPTEAASKAINKDGYPTGYGIVTPNIEDINRDNTLNTVESYYQYHIKISPNDINPSSVGSNYIVDAFDGTAEFTGVTKTVKWYQFKIPISQFESNVGGIEGFNSIRFMRVYMTGFERPVLVRLARFELVRSDWRRYQGDLRQPGEYIANDNNNTSFDVSAVSLQENANKSPVNYVMPPEIEQQQNVQTTNLVLLNEQSLSMRTCDLKDGDSRAVFKNVDLDTRMFENIKMNVHAEALNNIPLNDGDLNLFFRVGTDYNSNFYEYEVPLKLTPKGVYNPNSVDSRAQVWLKENEVNFSFNEISEAKRKRNDKYGYFSELNNLTTPFPVDMGGYTITIVGNPNLGTVKSIMVGIRNPKSPDKLSHCAEVWINELRLTNFNNQGGFATTGQVQAKLADLGMLSLAGTYKTPFWGGVESKINERSKETSLNWDVSTSINAGKFFPDKWKISLPVFYNFGQTRITPLFNPLDPDVRMKALDDIEITKEKRDEILRETQDFTERRGFNLTNVRIDGLKRPKAKPRFWDISNFSATYAFSEIHKRNVNVEYNYIRQYRGNLQYSYSIRNPITLKPFTKVKFLQNKWFTLIKDFNLQLVPNSFGTSIDVNRNYTSLKNRDITQYYAGSDVFDNPALINKNFTMTRNYNFVWAFNKSLKFDFTANNDGRILEPAGERVTKATRNEMKNTFFNGLKDKDGRDSINRFGENILYRQQMNLNVDVPINKIPIFDFMRVNYRYGGTYTWTRRPFAANDSIGNTIQNTRSNNVTGTFNMTQLYNKIPYFRRVNNPGSGGKPQLRGSSNNLNVSKTDNVDSKDGAAKDSSNFKAIGELLARIAMMLKNISVTGAVQGGQGLPNFLPSSQYGGMDFTSQGAAPGFLFTTGLYDKDIIERSITNDWLSKYKNQTTPYIENESTSYSYKANVEPHGSLKIELNGNYSLSKTKSSYVLYRDTATAETLFRGYQLNGSPNESGSFNISTFTFFNSFKDGNDPVNSTLFDEFRLTRRDMARELGQSNTSSNYVYSEITYTVPNASSPGGIGTESYVDGYTDNQQDVLLGAFYRTYTGRDIKDYNTRNIFPTIPLPNWIVSWDGLSKLKVTKKIFTGITLRHGYKSTYGINGFSNNLYFNPNGQQNTRMPVSQTVGGSEINPNFVPYYTIGSVTMSERYEPLIKFDFRFHNPKWAANMETRRDKSTTLNLTAFQIIETKGQEYIIGGAYTIPKLRLDRIKIQGKVLESSLNLRLDLSFRKNISVIRQVETGLSTPTGGTNIITLRSSADYQLTPNVTLRLFYDWVRTRPQTSASFPTSSTNGGFSLRITFQ